MKKFTAILLTAAITLSLAACGGQGAGEDKGEQQQSHNIKDSLELLTTVWESFGEEEKFPAAGGDMSEENMSMEGPGRFGVEDGAMLDSTLGFPAASAGEIDDAASLVHMMNANTFTCGVYHVKNPEGVKELAGTVKENILSRQWMCGFPETLVIMTVDDYIISFFGNGEIIKTFKDKVSAAYEGAEVVVEEPIA